MHRGLIKGLYASVQTLTEDNKLMKNVVRALKQELVKNGIPLPEVDTQAKRLSEVRRSVGTDSGPGGEDDAGNNANPTMFAARLISQYNPESDKQPPSSSFLSPYESFFINNVRSQTVEFARVDTASSRNPTAAGNSGPNNPPDYFAMTTETEPRKSSHRARRDSSLARTQRVSSESDYRIKRAALNLTTATAENEKEEDKSRLEEKGWTGEFAGGELASQILVPFPVLTGT